jgi:hypothetical protein
MPNSNTRIEPRLNKLSFLSFINREGAEQKTPVSLGRTLNISQTGVGIEVFQEVASGSIMEMEIALSEEIIPVNGKVVHSRPFSSSSWYIGIVFDTPQGKLASVVLESE